VPSPVELPKLAREQAVASLQRYAAEHLEQELGDLPAGLLLDFMLEEIGPLVYNQAIADAQARVLSRVGDLSGELFAEEFPYWPRTEAKRRRR